MMNKKSQYLAILLGIVLVASSSCSKILNQEPKNSTYSEKFWQTGRDAKFAVAGNFALLRTAIAYRNRYNMYGDAIAKSYYVIDYNGDGLEGIQNGDFTFQYNVNDFANWGDFFKVITMSNEVIKRLPQMTNDMLSDDEDAASDPDAFRNRMIGQALFIRAYTYFTMTRIWGDVPLVLEAYADPISAPQLPRNSKAEVIAQIIKDAKEAASLLSWGYDNLSSSAGPTMATRGSAYALLAHTYLWKATTENLSTVNLTDVHSADTTITALMTNGGYMVTDTANYYSTYIGKSKESIFEIAMSEDQTEGSNASIGMQFLRSVYIQNKGDYARMAVQPAYLTDHFGAVGSAGRMDVRYQKNFDYVSSSRPLCRKYSNVIYRKPGLKQDPFLSNNLVIFRLTDFQLLRAEIAIYESRYADAVTIINAVRARNNAPIITTTPSNKEDMLRLYMRERGIELYLEGHNFYDVVRTGFSQTVDWLTAQRRAAGGFYWPVDPKMFRGNPFLKQTPYWLGKV